MLQELKSEIFFLQDLKQFFILIETIYLINPTLYMSLFIKSVNNLIRFCTGDVGQSLMVFSRYQVERQYSIEFLYVLNRVSFRLSKFLCIDCRFMLLVIDLCIIFFRINIHLLHIRKLVHFLRGKLPIKLIIRL